MIAPPGPAYLTALAIGALHGLEPGHGWPVAAVYALGRRRRWVSGLAAGALVGGAHLVSSFAVVALFTFLDRWLGITETPWASWLAGLALVAIGLVQWVRGSDHRHSPDRAGDRHDHDEEERLAESGLLGLAGFAFVLGFAHEEEFAILALCAGRASCWGVMGAYALAVATVILGLTLASIAAFDRFRSTLEPWRNRLPRVSAVVLGAMGLLYLLGIL